MFSGPGERTSEQEAAVDAWFQAKAQAQEETSPATTDSPSLMKSASAGKITGQQKHSIAAKVGLNHLDNLCRLMEQLSDLKDQNVVLQRRVQYLEDIKLIPPLSAVPRTGRPSITEDNINQGRFILPDVSISADPDGDQGDREGNNEQWMFEWNAAGRPKRKTVSGPAMPNRSKGFEVNKDRVRSKSAVKSGLEDRRESPTLSAKGKISKWAKVKEAFKWEKVGHDQRASKGT
jgi:hypothetical protein